MSVSPPICPTRTKRKKPTRSKQTIVSDDDYAEDKPDSDSDDLIPYPSTPVCKGSTSKGNNKEWAGIIDSMSKQHKKSTSSVKKTPAEIMEDQHLYAKETLEKVARGLLGHSATSSSNAAAGGTSQPQPRLLKLPPPPIVLIPPPQTSTPQAAPASTAISTSPHTATDACSPSHAASPANAEPPAFEPASTASITAKLMDPSVGGSLSKRSASALPASRLLKPAKKKIRFSDPEGSPSPPPLALNLVDSAKLQDDNDADNMDVDQVEGVPLPRNPIQPVETADPSHRLSAQAPGSPGSTSTASRPLPAAIQLPPAPVSRASLPSSLLQPALGNVTRQETLDPPSSVPLPSAAGDTSLTLPDAANLALPNPHGPPPIISLARSSPTPKTMPLAPRNPRYGPPPVAYNSRPNTAPDPTGADFSTPDGIPPISPHEPTLSNLYGPPPMVPSAHPSPMPEQISVPPPHPCAAPNPGAADHSGAPRHHIPAPSWESNIYRDYGYYQLPPPGSYRYGEHGTYGAPPPSANIGYQDTEQQQPSFPANNGHDTRPPVSNYNSYYPPPLPPGSYGAYGAPYRAPMHYPLPPTYGPPPPGLPPPPPPLTPAQWHMRPATEDSAGTHPEIPSRASSSAPPE
ncbi:hypothetical protein C0991_000275 [Blastosporella zonata]|nr:hypothetical protein C0991_000275 [Blastosporella zonata]